MITIEHTPRLLNVAVLGEFTLSDYREFEQQMLFEIKYQGSVNVLLDLRDMVRYTVDVAWEEIKFTRAHAREFGRVAIVTDDQWLSWSAWLTRWFADAEIQVFPDYDEALAWVLPEEAGAR